jgi:hypothetical protein
MRIYRFIYPRVHAHIHTQPYVQHTIALKVLNVIRLYWGYQSVPELRILFPISKIQTD